MKLKKITFGLIALFSFMIMNAADYVTVAKNSKVYDEANAKYATLNQFSEEIEVLPGMVFATQEHTPGWYKIEYVSGVHGFIPDQIVASTFKPVQPGVYTIVNNPDQKLSVEGSGNNWTATINGQTYKGVKAGEIIVFYDNMNTLLFSLVDIGNGPVAMTYDNTITCFF